MVVLGLRLGLVGRQHGGQDAGEGLRDGYGEVLLGPALVLERQLERVLRDGVNQEEQVHALRGDRFACRTLDDQVDHL